MSKAIKFELHDIDKGEVIDHLESSHCMVDASFYLKQWIDDAFQAVNSGNRLLTVEPIDINSI